MLCRSVMIVEDDRDIREGLQEFLEMEGAKAILCAHGREALEKLESLAVPPDAILLDLMMPEMDGTEFRKEQLRRGLHAPVPLVVMTAAASPDARVKEIRPDRLLKKPVDLDQLVQTLNEVCGSACASADASRRNSN